MWTSQPKYFRCNAGVLRKEYRILRYIPSPPNSYGVWDVWTEYGYSNSLIRRRCRKDYRVENLGLHAQAHSKWLALIIGSHLILSTLKPYDILDYWTLALLLHRLVSLRVANDSDWHYTTDILVMDVGRGSNDSSCISWTCNAIMFFGGFRENSPPLETRHGRCPR